MSHSEFTDLCEKAWNLLECKLDVFGVMIILNKIDCGAIVSEAEREKIQCFVNIHT